MPRWATLPEYKPLYECREVRVDSERIAALSHGSNESNLNPPSDAQKAKRAYWAAGTGYGHGYCKGQNKEIWDAKKATAAQNAHDIEVQTLLINLTESLSSELEANSIELLNVWSLLPIVDVMDCLLFAGWGSFRSDRSNRANSNIECFLSGALLDKGA